MARTASFNHPLRKVYIAENIEAAKESAFFKDIQKEIEEIENNPTAGVPMIHEDVIVIVKDHVFVDPIEYLEGWFKEEEEAKDLIEYTKMSLSWIN